MHLNFRTPADFVSRHIGPNDEEIAEMLETVGASSLDELMGQTIPPDIRMAGDLALPHAVPEHHLIRELRTIAAKNQNARSYIGMGYAGTVTPGVIQRNILENPGWYTQYTPYQAEIAQGRLEALLNYQTMLIDLTGLPIANASLLDEGTAAAEAMTLVLGSHKTRSRFLVASECNPQTIAVVQTRAEPLGIDVVVAPADSLVPDEETFGVLLPYPDTDGAVFDRRPLIASVHEAGGHVIMVADLLALTLLTPPGELGADVVVGNTQRFGVPMGYGGPHAAYMAAQDAFKRRMPGRIIGVSVDADGNSALRMALQTREQHIRREKATSNICTAQVLLAVMAGMYAVYHGPKGLKLIAERIHGLTVRMSEALEWAGHDIVTKSFFDTVRIKPVGKTAAEVVADARAAGINLRDFGDGTVCVALDETVEPEDVVEILAAFGVEAVVETLHPAGGPRIPEALVRTSAYLEHQVFNRYHSETEMLRYMHRLESRDLALNTSMIALGSCTMKLNATTQMVPVTFPEFGQLHPFAPIEQAQGYQRIFGDLENWLAAIAGFEAVSLQPNSGAQGEYTGLLVIRAYHRSRGDTHRNVCLIPASAHGTNPASAVMCGMQVKIVKTDADGSIDLDDLRAKATEHADSLAALMITYPSTHGVFEAEVREVCEVIHSHGGQVYLDGANLNAQVGLSRPGDYGADVCHINLHKTFAIPHGGGGPGMGPICVAGHLAPFLPGHPVVDGVGGDQAIGPVSAAPWGSSSILLISWAYMALLGPDGCRKSSQAAILNANYMAKRLEEHFEVLYRGDNGRVAHEFILDLTPFRKSADITEEDVAKRFMDYGFHAPTMSFPVAGTIMVEPTESESKAELDRFCDALISIKAEIQQIEMGIMDRDDNPLKNAPHTSGAVTADEWTHPYGRQQAAFPAPWTREHKFWPHVRRVNNAHGDRNLVCACPPIEAYGE